MDSFTRLGQLLGAIVLCGALHGAGADRNLELLGLWSPATIRDSPLLTLGRDGTPNIADNLNEDEVGVLQTQIVRIVEAAYRKKLFPMKTRNYARKKGVLDRIPLERFMDKAREVIGDQKLRCLEWGPFFTRWPNVTQPYMKKFNCAEKWTFHHETADPHVKVWWKSVYGELDRGLEAQGLSEVRSFFDLVIIPQTLQYVRDPLVSMSVLYDLVKPGGHIIFTSPFIQAVMPYPVDYYRFTAEGAELALQRAGFHVLKSYVAGDDFWSICWIMHCGRSDLSEDSLALALVERGGDYQHNSYMLSMQIAQRPLGQ
mmetsp:Transcript_22883/g.58349  ORF Transcript_22883/g.58349 Transcript_22883/m.58349 type:complete len:314 (-) Transcript_22883:557-1498(-)